MSADGKAKLKLLYIEDSKMDAELVLRALRKEGLQLAPLVVDSAEGLADALLQSWHVVLSDCNLPLIRVDEALKMVREVDENVPFIAVSGAIGEEEAVSLLKSGAQDFIGKQSLSRLVPAILRELKEAEGRRERIKAERALTASEERFQLAMLASNDGLWDWHITANRVYFSPRWKSMLGYPEHSLDDDIQTLRELIHPEDRAVWDEAVPAFMCGQSDRCELQYRMRCHSGEYKDILSRVFIQRREGKVQRITGTHVDISEQKRYERQLRELSSHLQWVREEEKAHIAQEIHDELGATFTALNMDVHWLATKLPKSRVDLVDKASAMGALVREAAQASNRIVNELRPSMLDDLGFLATVEWQLKQFQARYAIHCRLHSNVAQINLRKNRSVALFRIFQESLTNIAKHAQASSVDVIVLVRVGRLIMEVRDNGVGLPGGVAQRSRSHGVSGMRERAEYLGGDLVIESDGANEGVRVVLNFALRDTEEAR